LPAQSRLRSTSLRGERRRGPLLLAHSSVLLVPFCVRVSTPATIRYYDIGDYLDRDEKLKIIRTFSNIGGIESAKKWSTIQPNTENDWINQRDKAFGNFIELSGGIFADSFGGVKTNRDDWCYTGDDQ
ncbi:MAG: hypothetical protein ACRDHZ_25525, partial [Ktedonobacteraceae bacterium]